MVVKGIVFDKDGTLFSFSDTWTVWAKALLLDVAEGDHDFAAELGRLVGFDYVNSLFSDDSIVIAGTPEEIATAMLPALNGMHPFELVERMNAVAEEAPVAEAAPLVPLLSNLAARDIKLGLATNDAEAPARANLGQVGVTHMFDFIAGSDSGHGFKPEPGMLLAFASMMGIAPQEAVMVGDSTHDLFAGRAAGMRTVAVLTGMAREEELAPHADVVLPHIGHIPAWLDKIV